MAYSFSRSITIDHTKCGSTDSTNFPFLFAGTYSWLATVANGGNVQNSNGYDIVFASDAAGTTLLSWEIDSYNPTTGAVAFHVKIPTVSHTTDTVFYILYGNGAITTFQSTATAVWDSNYVCVTHFKNTSGLVAADSTSNANNGVVTGVTVAPAAQIGDAAAFDGSTAHFVRLPTSTSLNVIGAVTMEAWVYPTASGTYQAIIDRGASSSLRDYAFFFAPTVGDMYVAFGNSTSGDHGPFTPLTPRWVLNAWNHVAVTHDGSSALVVYVNGSVVYTNTIPFPPTSTAHDVYYGNELGNSFPLTGRLDECRISKTARSADWILTQYNNQSSPSTFYSVGGTAPVGYSFVRAITVDHTKCGSTNSANFPFLFTGTYSWLATVVNSGAVTSPSGFDIIFASDASGTTLLSFERVNYNATTGFCEFWVKVPTLSHTSDTVIYVLYGNASVTTDQQNKPAVWDSNFMGVWHLQDITHLADSTGNNIGVANGSPTSATGKVNGGVAGTGSAADFINFGAVSNMFNGVNSIFTISGWFFPTSVTGSLNGYPFGIGSWSPSAPLIRMIVGHGNADNQVWLDYYTDNTGANGLNITSTATTLVNNTWYHIYATLDLGTPSNSKIYVNGSLVAATILPAGTVGVFSALANIVTLMRSNTNTAWLGSEDEVRINNSARSADWVISEYNNQNSPSTFYSVGSAGAVPPPSSFQQPIIFIVT